MSTRRAFLQQGTLAAAGLWLGPRLQPSARRRPAFGLFFDVEALPALRSRFATDPLFAPLRNQLAAFDRAAERRFLAEEVRYNDHLFHIHRIGRAAPSLAFAYMMTGDEDAADLAVAAIRALLQFPKWDYFLEAGQDVIGLQRAPSSTVAVALCADWLGDYVDDTERAAWIHTMGERGCEPCYRATYGMRYPERVVGWTVDPASTYFEHRPGDRIDLGNWPRILDRTNLKAVPAAALAIGAVVHQQQFGRSPETARWLDQAVFSLTSFRDLYARDGAYDENISYANYTSLQLAQATTILQRFHGVDLYDTINWPGFVDFITEMTIPTTDDPHGIVNFGDAGDAMMSAVPFWIARRSRDGQAQWFGRQMARGHDVWSLIWYDASVAPRPPAARPHLWRSDLDWVVARTGYAADDLVVAMRSGGPANHEHADRNSVVVKAYGEVLVADPYRPPYSFSDPAWMLRTTAGHSALLIDGQGHQYHDGSEGTNPSDAVARIVRQGERDGYLFWASDATPAYRLVLPDVQVVTRTVVVLHTLPAVLIIDNVQKDATPSTLEARFYVDNRDGQARIEGTEAGFVTHRPGARLRGGAASVQGVACRSGVLPIPEETARRHPYAAAATTTPAKAPMLVTALLPERTGEAAASVTFSEVDGVIEVTLHQAGRTARCRLFDAGVLPEFEVIL